MCDIENQIREAPTTEPDQTLIRARARGRRWMADLLDGVHGSVAELAAAYGTDMRYLARHLPLACLSPAIIDAILEGRQPIELTTWHMLNRIEIPLDWDDQARRLGCCDPVPFYSALRLAIHIRRVCHSLRQPQPFGRRTGQQRAPKASNSARKRTGKPATRENRVVRAR